MLYTRKELGFVALLTLALLVFALIVLEIGLTILRPTPNAYDSLLGWRDKENFSRKFPQKTFGGQDYVASFSTDARGLRVFGANQKAPMQILVLGDSFTADPYASNDRMWYVGMTERLAQKTNRPLQDFYVQAGGSGGWGTYQELLLAQQLAQAIHPNLFVLQFCPNDFQNNNYEWESQSIVRQQYLRRPFANLDTGVPEYAPGFMGVLYRSFIGRSRVFNRIDVFVEAMQYGKYGGYTKPLLPVLTQKYERDSLAVTKALLAKLRNVYAGIPAVMVNCSGDETGLNRFWKDIAQSAGFIPVASPSDFLRALTPEEKRSLLNADGAHMSEDGNQRYGALAGDEIVSLGLIDQIGK